MRFIGFLVITCTLLAACSASHHLGKTQPYESSIDSTETKVLKGLPTSADVENDSAYKWFKPNYNLGQANVQAVQAF